MLLARESYVDSDPFVSQIGTMLGELSSCMTSSSSKSRQSAPISETNDPSQNHKEQLLFIEFACDEDSEIGIEGPKLGIKVMRCNKLFNDCSR